MKLIIRFTKTGEEVYRNIRNNILQYWPSTLQSKDDCSIAEWIGISVSKIHAVVIYCVGHTDILEVRIMNESSRDQPTEPRQADFIDA